MRKILLLILEIFCILSVKAKRKISVEDQLRLYDYLFDGESYEDVLKKYDSLNSSVSDIDAKEVKFFIFGKHIRGEKQLNFNEPDTIKNTLNTQIPTRVLIHGWRNSRLSDMVRTVRDAYLKNNIPVNIIVVDWGAYSKNFYFIVRSRVNNVAVVVANFLKILITKYGLKTEQIHLIGYSLGAHIAGLIGKNMKDERIPVIYGLDPAAPLFKFHKQDERLDASDADYVEVIHTSAGLLGYENAIGTTDFYANFGYSQPGCWIDLLYLCAHSRSYKYFAESITSKVNVFWGVQCKNGVDDMETESCSTTGHFEILGGNFMKFNKVKKPGVYYVATRASAPFAKGTIKGFITYF